MIKVEVIEEFTLGAFKELKNIKRINADVDGRLFVGDTFECTEEMTKYLTGKNNLKRAFVKVIEVIPEIKKEPIKKTTIKKTIAKKNIAKKK